MVHGGSFQARGEPTSWVLVLVERWRGGSMPVTRMPPLPVTRIALYSVWSLTQWGLCSSRPQGLWLHRTLDRCASDSGN